METKRQNLKKVSVNPKNLNLLIQNYKFTNIIKEAKNKDLVLFLGLTGSGKSTCITYFLGGKLNKCRIGKQVAILDPAEPLHKFPKIGTKARKSCTLYSEIFHDSNLEISLCDTAGFKDKRRFENEKRICASLSTELAVQSAKSIKAIVIVIDWNIFQTKTNKDFEDLMIILGELLLPPYEDISDSLFFLINQVPEDINKDDLSDFLLLYNEYRDEIKEEMYCVLRELSILGEKTSEEFLKLNSACAFLNLLDLQLKQRPKNVILIDVFDGGEKRAEVLNILQARKTFVPKDKFNFKNYDSSRKYFDEEIDTLAISGADLLKRYCKALKDLSVYQDALINNENKSRASRALTQYIKANDNTAFSVAKNNLIDFINEQIEYSSKDESVHTNLQRSNDEKMSLLVERSILDSSNPTLIYHETFSQSVSAAWFDWEWSKFAFRAEKTFIYPHNIAFLHYHAKGVGTFEEITMHKMAGICQINYKSNYGENGLADFKVFCEKRLFPANKRRLLEIKKEISEVEAEISAEIIRLEKEKLIKEQLKELLSKVQDMKFDETSYFKDEVDKSSDTMTNASEKQELEKIKNELCDCLMFTSSVSMEVEKINLEQAIVSLKVEIETLNEEIILRVDVFNLLEDLSRLFVASANISNFLRNYAEYKKHLENTKLIQAIKQEEALKRMQNFAVSQVMQHTTLDDLNQIEKKLKKLLKLFSIRSSKDNSISNYDYRKIQAFLYLCTAYQTHWKNIKESRSHYIFLCVNHLLESIESYPHRKIEISDILLAIILYEISANALNEKELIQLIDIFIHNLSVQQKDSHGNTLLHISVESGNILIVNYLLTRNVDVTCKNHQGKTSIFLAAQNKHVLILKALLEHEKPDLKVNSDFLIDSNQNHILIFLLQTSSYVSDVHVLEIIEALCAFGAKLPLKLVRQTENSILHKLVAALTADKSLLNTFFTQLNEKSTEFKLLTALLSHLNALEKQECLRVIFQGKTLLDFVLTHDSLNMVIRILEIFIVKDTAMDMDILVYCIETGQYEVTTFLLEQWKGPIDLNILLPNKKTLLSLAIQFNRVKLVELLLKYKVNTQQVTLAVLSQSVLNRKGFSSIKSEDLHMYLYLSHDYFVGTAVDDGGCFFDSFAQVVNCLEGAPLHTEKSLREKCYRYYQKNSQEVEKWRVADYAKSVIVPNYDSVRYTSQESPLGKVIWGGTQVEGIVLCRMLDIGAIYVAEIMPDPDNSAELTIGYYAITQMSYQSIRKIDIPDGVPLLAVSLNDLHFIPILPHHFVSPVRLCVLENNIPALHILTQLIGTVTEKNILGQTLFHTAALMGNLEMLKALESKLPVSERFAWLLSSDNNGNTPLNLTIKHHHTHCTEWMVEMGKKYNESHREKSLYWESVLHKPNKLGQTALMMAVKSHNVAAVQLCFSSSHSFWSREEGDKALQLALSDDTLPSSMAEDIKASKIVHCIELVKIHLQGLLSQASFHIPFLNRWIIQLEKVLHEKTYQSYRKLLMSMSMSSLQVMAEQLSIGIAHAIREKYHSEDHKILLQNHVQENTYHAWDYVLRTAIDKTLSMVSEQVHKQRIRSENPRNNSESKSDKHRAFTRALKDALRNYFYVSRALYEGKVLMNAEGLNALKAAYNIASPIATEIGAALTSVNIGVISGFVSAALELVTRLRDAQYQCEAGRFVQAFGLCQPDAIEKYEKDISIDHDQLKAVAEALYRRYRDQIEQCTLSKEAEISLRLAKTDGIYVLANVMADRIFQHIIKKESVKVEDDRTVMKQIFDWFETIGADKDIYKELSLIALPERCILAVLYECVGEDRDAHIRTDLWLRKGCKTEDIWMAGGILVKTGLKIESNPTELYIRQGNDTQESMQAKYGYCYLSDSMVNLKEIEKRKFVKAPPTQLDILTNQLSQTDEKEVMSCFISKVKVPERYPYSQRTSRGLSAGQHGPTIIGGPSAIRTRDQRIKSVLFSFSEKFYFLLNSLILQRFFAMWCSGNFFKIS